MPQIAIKRKKSSNDPADMDITPMIDCTFLLLIFFLVTSKMDSNKSIPLPKAKYGVAAVEVDAVILTLGKGPDGNAVVYLGNGMQNETRCDGSEAEQEEKIVRYVETEANNLSGRGAAQARTTAKNTILIKAGPGIKHREVARITKAATKAKIGEDVEIEQVFLGITKEQ